MKIARVIFTCQEAYNKIIKDRLTEYAAPVSYTHLDVYKRQAYCLSPAC